MYGHDWIRGRMTRGAATQSTFRGFVQLPEMFVWKCRKCKALVQASDSAGLPDHEPSLNGRHLTCDEVILSSVHDS